MLSGQEGFQWDILQINGQQPIVHAAGVDVDAKDMHTPLAPLTPTQPPSGSPPTPAPSSSAMVPGPVEPTSSPAGEVAAGAPSIPMGTHSSPDAPPPPHNPPGAKAASGFAGRTAAGARCP